jgi:non-specific serine/threonine protein kinase
MDVSGQNERAADLWCERLDLYRELGMARGVADSLNQLAFLARRNGLFERAVCLFSAASAIRRHQDSAWYEFNRLDVDHELGILRTTLPDDTFQRAWDQGQYMSTEAAVEFALRSASQQSPSHSIRIGGLTLRESEVLVLVARQMSNRQIATELFISTRTVERHIENIYRKLDIHSRAEAIDFGRQHLPG